MSKAQGDPGDENVTFLPFAADEIAPQVPRRPTSQGELDEARAELREAARRGPQLSSEEAQALREGEIMKSFVKHPGWDIMLRIVNSQLEQGIRRLLEPASGEAGALSAEYQKGVLQGFKLFALTPQGIIQTANGLRSAHGIN